MTVNHENYGFIKQIWYLLRRVIYYIEKKDMNICIYTVHSFLYECITCKLKSCLSNYCTYYISYVTTIIQNYHKITSKKKIILGGHPVALVVQAKDFHQHHIWCFPLPCTGEEISLNATHPLHWSAVMSSHTAVMTSNRDIWSCDTFHLILKKW